MLLDAGADSDLEKQVRREERETTASHQLKTLLTAL
jgi:hypothetical protein